MNITRVEMEDFQSILKIFKEVKAELSKQKNDQWKWIYPNYFNYKSDIKSGIMYGIKEGNEYIAVVALDDKQSKKYQLLNWQDKDGKHCCIHRLAVLPKLQGQGIGKYLLQYIEKLAIEEGYTSVRIDVYKSNETAIALYEKTGYKRIGEVRYPLRKLSYVSMEKQLK